MRTHLRSRDGVHGLGPRAARGVPPLPRGGHRGSLPRAPASPGLGGCVVLAQCGEPGTAEVAEAVAHAEAATREDWLACEAVKGRMATWGEA